MRRRSVVALGCRRHLVGFLGCLALATTACEAPQSSTSTVTRARLGDTLVVTTDPGLDQGPSLYTIALDLTIGELDGPEEYVLFPTSVSADGEGRIFVSNQREGEVRIFDAQGRYLRRFGRRGNGPGEFNSNSWGWFHVRPVAGQRLTVEDLPRLRIFDAQGAYLSSFDLLSVLVGGERRYARSRGIVWLPEMERIVARWSPVLPEGGVGESVVLLSDSLTVLLELPAREVTGGSFEGEGWSLTLPHGPDYEWALAGNRILAWGVSGEYRIDLYDLERGQWVRVVFPLPPDPVTRDDIQAYKDDFLSQRWVRGQEEIWEPRLNRAEYPATKPYFAGILGDDEGRIWVQRYSPIPGPDGEDWIRYDLFDGDGRWLGVVDSPVAFEEIRNGFGYRIERAVFPRVERYRLVESFPAGAGR